MKQLLTSLLLGLSVLASAQSDGFQYPFPYNPDGNSDGYISLNDMLDLLSVYGQEYPQSFYSDTTIAVLNLGKMGAHNCQAQAKQAGSDWRIPRISELARFSPAAVNAIPQGQSASAWYLDRSNILVSSWSFTVATATYDPNYESITRADSSEAYNVTHNYNSTTYVTQNKTCFLVSEIRPEFEFSYCSSTSGSNFSQCVTTRLNEGWIPMPGGNGQYLYQGFWKIVED